MDSTFFDVVVCGPDLCGAVTAALLGRRGMRVLLCGHDGVPPTFTAGEHTLASGPGLLPPPDGEPVARVLREINHLQIIRRRAPAGFPALQFVFPQHRVDLPAVPELLERELAREFPGDEPAIAQALERLRATSDILDPILGSDITLPPDGFWERREVGRVEDQLPTSGADLLAPLPTGHPMRAGIAALAALGSGLGPGEVGPMVQARAYDVARRGAFRLEGGIAAVRALFYDRLGTSSGEVREKVMPVEVMFRRGRVVGLRLRPRDETIGLEHLVWAGSVAQLVRMCGDKANRRLRELATGVRPACYRYTLCLLVRPEAIPAGMGPRVIAVRDPGQPVIEDNALAITVGTAARLRSDRVPLWVECLVPATAASAGSGYLAVLRARIRKQLSQLLPFFERHLLVLASPHDGLTPDLGSSDKGGAAPDPIIATPMTAALACDLPRALGVAGIPHATGTKNLYLANSENLPGLGPEGEFVSAWGAARLIAGPRPRRETARREILIEDA